MSGGKKEDAMAKNMSTVGTAADTRGNTETAVAVVRSGSLKALLDQRDPPERVEVQEVAKPTQPQRVEYGYD